jgi:tRNA-splicing ligase RtcB
VVEMKLKKLSSYTWELSKDSQECMRVPGRIYINKKLLKDVEDGALRQCANVACLPGIRRYSIAMPDIHYGYGFPIGGVAAFDAEEGVISPGGVGFDINCGVRLIRTDLSQEEIKPKIKELTDHLFGNIPSGVGKHGKIRVSKKELDSVLRLGALWAVEAGYGWKEDLEYIEEGGRMEGADPRKVSDFAKKRGMPQLGTLGSGNHFLEIQVVDEIYDSGIAGVYGIQHEGQVIVMIHSGSRGCGHQICSDYLGVMERAVKKYNISLPDRQLVCAPASSPEAQEYYAAMQCGVNYGFANRQAIAHWTRESFERILGRDAHDMGMHTVYEVAHNIAKLEEHIIDGEKRKVYVHRKGATRAFGPGSKDIPKKYFKQGQPVLIPGDMGSASYLLAGTTKAMLETFGSTCHGAGRKLSRAQAKRQFWGETVKRKMAEEGIYLRAASKPVIAEEAHGAYKEVSEVVESAQGAGISLLVARLRPLGVAKG